MLALMFAQPMQEKASKNVPPLGQVAFYLCCSQTCKLQVVDYLGTSPTIRLVWVFFATASSTHCVHYIMSKEKLDSVAHLQRVGMQRF